MKSYMITKRHPKETLMKRKNTYHTTIIIGCVSNWFLQLIFDNSLVAHIIHIYIYCVCAYVYVYVYVYAYIYVYVYVYAYAYVCVCIYIYVYV